MRTGLILLDRDGVINDDRGEFVRSVEDWRPFPGSLEAIARIAKAGWEVVVVSNQSGLARGLFDETALEAIHRELHAGVEALGGRIAGILFCPHHPDDGCACRKPQPGLVHQAERLLGRSVRGAPFVGDRLSDLDAARRGGCRPILVRTGRGAGIAADDPAVAGVAVHRDLAEAIDALLEQAAGGSGR